ncbi:zinc fingers and homeoboxes protein 2a [Hypomesus transpacificus]|uniref:zinc fingers and homeoboxes protein 2a n=1 Tax=Hypomesus transpacificus TaxID=137520 RepID=UPI001F07670C|nr:zinc fingers and homeoboxes protein 2a [Hypomesus transpacificus]XP_046883956.1 zinc fingers and homeoboxes protein 2a [Hypomesus transpacificus]
MSSRRKSTTPCMIRPNALDQGAPEQDEMEASRDSPAEEGPPQMDIPSEMQPPVVEPSCPPQLSPALERPETDPKPPQRKHQGGGYECKYCPFSTQNINEFKEHVDANHPNVILNPLYLCAVCNFNTKKFDTLTEHNERFHPGESNFKFKRVKLNNQTILEQTIEGSSNAVIYNTSGAVSRADIATFPLSRSTTVKIGKSKTDNKRTLPESQLGKLTPELSKKQITALNVNGTVIIPEATLKDGLSHIMPSLQRPPNYNLVPKIAVPLNTSKYNPSLDGNLTLITSFNKFPYPTQAELSWLTAASKHPEEQIKVWFTTQRLKQGISWSPEEVEEARKKMFNGTIQSVPHTFTVLPAQLTPQSTKSPHSLLQTIPCQVLGQTSLVLTQVTNGSTVTCAPIALTLANQVAQSVKRPLASPVVVGTEIKRPSIIQTVQTAPKIVPPKFVFTADSNKTPDQLAVLKASYTQCQFPEEEEVYRLIETTGLSRGEIKKWFSEQRLLNLKSAPQVKSELPSKDALPKITIPTHFPLLERVKGKSSEQLKTLEESFQRSSSPTEAEVDQLVENSRLSKTEIDCWFLERRALRDNLEQALLNSMGPKIPEDYRGVQNGVHEQQDGKIQSSSLPLPLPLLLASTSPEPIDSKSLGLLKEVFTQTQWPSPEEYNHLEVQTGLARIDIVRWFKDNRSALKNGTLEWMEQFQNLNSKAQNSQSSLAVTEKTQSVLQPSPAKVLKLEEDADKMPECSKLQPVSNKDIVQWFTNKLGQSMSDLSRARDQPGQAAIDRGRWVKVTMAVGEEGKGLDMQRLGPEAEVLAVDHPGRVTG